MESKTMGKSHLPRFSAWMRSIFSVASRLAGKHRLFALGDATLCLYFLLCTLCLAACGNVASANRTEWWENAPGPLGDAGKNAYGTDIERYPGFGIVSRIYDGKALGREEEEKIVAECIKQCRQEFTLSYLDRKLVAWDSFKTQRKDWLEGRQQTIPFQPEWIVVLIAKGEVQDGERLPSPAAHVYPPFPANNIYPVGYVFSASDIFRTNISNGKLIAKAFRTEKPIHIDRSPSIDRYKYIYNVIELFRLRTFESIE